jgi:sugar phosphate isomerase/epimerase
MRHTFERRRFIQSVVAGVAASSGLWGRAADKKLPITFSTLGCPKWDWNTILTQAEALGYAAIELRGLQGEMDLGKRPEFSGTRINKSLGEVEGRGLKIAGLGASSRMHESQPAIRAAQIDEGKRFIDLAHQLKAPYVRIFGDKIPDPKEREATIDRVIAGFRELGQYAKGSGVNVILESHGDFTDSKTLLQILKGAEMPTTGLLWDTHHTVVMGKEAPDVTFKTLGRYIRHTHIKDSKPEGNGVRYVLPGQGTVPLGEIVSVLAKGGYRGYYGLEWEKAWHPEIEEPEVAFAHYAKIIRTHLAAAGVTA